MDVIDGTFVVVIPDLSQRLIGRQTVLSIRAVCFLLYASQTLARNRQPSLQICSHRQYSLVPGAGIDPARHGRFPVKPKAMYQTSCSHAHCHAPRRLQNAPGLSRSREAAGRGVDPQVDPLANGRVKVGGRRWIIFLANPSTCIRRSPPFSSRR